MFKVAITDHRFPHLEAERRAVEEAGGRLEVGQAVNEGAVAELCRDADGVITARAPITRRVISTMERCKIIVRYGIGIDTIDLAAATERGIMVANVPDYCAEEVSDHAIMLLLALSRQVMPAVALAKEERWMLAKMPRLHRLRGQTCGLFGAGQIGSLVAAKAAAFGMTVIAYDPGPHPRNVAIQWVSFDDLIERSDFISLHAPLNDQTRHLFGGLVFKRMKDTAFIINTARGGLIEESALITALDAGQIAGAGLDVVESESASSPERVTLANHPKVILTPHTAWLSEEARVDLQDHAAAQVIAGIRGERPYGLVNPAVKA